jgi:hypothetical protein
MPPATGELSGAVAREDEAGESSDDSDDDEPNSTSGRGDDDEPACFTPSSHSSSA